MSRFLRLVPLTIWALLLAETFLVVTIYLLAVAWMIPTDAGIWLDFAGGWVRILTMAAGVLLGIYMTDLYSRVEVSSLWELCQSIWLVVGIAFLFQAVLAYVSPGAVLPRFVMMTGSLSLLIVLPIWRWAFSRTVILAGSSQQVLFVGAGPVASRIMAEMRARPELGREVIGYLEEAPSPLLPRVEWLGEPMRVCAVAATRKPHRVVVDFGESASAIPARDLLHLRYNGYIVEGVDSAFEQTYGRICSDLLAPSQIVLAEELEPRPSAARLQSLYSFGLALGALWIASPVMLLVAILVRITSPGPVLYRQERVGLHGRAFRIIKFRSMQHGAEVQTGAVWAAKEDARATRVGKWLRKLRLDELPQLFNVLKGDMVLVGPRPERPEFLNFLSDRIPFYRQRLVVKPGITGWAQINYPYGDTLEHHVRKLEYDLFYIKNLSLALDLFILFHTAKVMALARGSR